MHVRENVPLAPLTTLHVGGMARYFIEAKTTDDIQKAIVLSREKKLPLFILSGGSNVIISDEGFPGVVLSPSIHGMEKVYEDSTSITLRVGAGEVLDTLITHTIAQSWWGMENLSYVPGNVGALAVQNVGCYGVEAKEIISCVEAIHAETGTLEQFSNTECSFGYRSSIFNTIYAGKYVITHITITLSKKPTPVLTYTTLVEHLSQQDPSQQNIRDTLIAIRKSKGFDPNKVWSAGSFFKNPIVSKEAFTQLSPSVAAKAISVPTGYKLPSAFLIDLLDLKDSSVGGAQISPLQANSIINTGSATAQDIHALFCLIQQKVNEGTGVRLENEPTFIGVFK